jgi:transcriptional regulator with XRE-family HTH domain
LATTPTRRGPRGGLGARLRALREAAGMSGTELADACGWGQPKVSKIETGRQLATEEDVRAWARAVGADPESLLALRGKTSAVFSAWRDQVAAAGGGAALQDEIAALQAACTRIAEYQPALIPGRLQTPAYAREIIGPKGLAEAGVRPEEIGAFIAAKLRRQAILYESGRGIIHIVGEAALRTRIGGVSTATMRAQLHHLAQLAELPGHTFGVIPFSVASPIEPACGFVLYDDDLVVVETLAGPLQISDPIEVAQFAQWSRMLVDVAVTGTEAAEMCRRIAIEMD